MPHDAAVLHPNPRSSHHDLDRLLLKFTARTAERGRSYHRQGRVKKLDLAGDGMSATALVKGSSPRPYKVEIALDDTGAAEGFCNCPVANYCKHAAAVVYAVAAAESRPGGPRRVEPLAGPLGAWLEGLAAAGNQKPESPEHAIYVIAPDRSGTPDRLIVQAHLVRRLKSGGFSAPRPANPENLARGEAKYVRPEDIVIGGLMVTLGRMNRHKREQCARTTTMLLGRLAESGRCHWQSKDGPVLGRGPAREGRIEWRFDRRGRQNAVVVAADEALFPLALGEPWYVDPKRAEMGPLDVGMAPGVVGVLLEAPPIPPEATAAVDDYMARHLKTTPVPRPQRKVTEDVVTETPTPVLRIGSHEVRSAYQVYWLTGYGYGPAVFDVARLFFAYGDEVIGAEYEDDAIRVVEDDRLRTYRRDAKSEGRAAERLTACGLAPYDQLARMLDVEGKPHRFTGNGSDERWARFLHRDVPVLRAEGWRVEIDPGFGHAVVDARGDWEADVAAETGWWFSLDLGVEVAGERIALLPLLMEAVKRMKDSPEASADAEEDTFYAPLPDGRFAALPRERVSALVTALVELYDHRAADAEGRLPVSPFQLAGLAESAFTWSGAERLREIVDRLRAAANLPPVPLPEGFKGDLRPYQKHGLDWLQYLRECGFGGILADDMGLGKTVQALAHILLEKTSGRMDRPALIVAPTSLVANWRAEAAAFAPDLRVLTLHGPDRRERFETIGEHDLVITTYPLLARDRDQLLAREWHIVVLDEAQAIKNPAAQAGQVARRLNARHRLCLTGTPVENNLGELWSLLGFLMPGMLGDHSQFRKHFRTPIEKHGDEDRRGVLVRRLKPFILRRTKGEVAADLPEKTEIVRQVEIGGGQRDLYETIRVSMQEKVRREIENKGLARSHIVVLDALLKLRQACCDPRLVKLAASRKVKESAKLAMLMEMLPELVGEGRRILLFSQFTSMLDLIKVEVDRLAIPYVELRGKTQDRETPVARFQAGEAPLFMISLKAGGTGLNLTAADTVIHYDPWWNPAVENQATDRAHRIGQDKNVFVYKLIAAGTVEERMVELQARKKALADIVSDAAATGPGLEVDDIESLLAPIT